MKQFCKVVSALLVLPATTHAAQNWQKILAQPESPPALPAPRHPVEWPTGWQQALALAKKKNRPLFVALRCTQCADFDKDVIEGGRELTPVLKQFVTVRLTSAAGIDLRLFPVSGYQDFDISWWGYLFSPDGHLYSVSGGHYAPGPGFFPLKISDAKRRKFKIPAGTMAIEPFMGKKAAQRPSYQAGLRPDDIVTAVDGKSQHYDFGDKTTFTAVNPNGNIHKITFELK